MPRLEKNGEGTSVKLFLFLFLFLFLSCIFCDSIITKEVSPLALAKNMGGFFDFMKARAGKTHRSTYANSQFWSIILVISFLVFMYGQFYNKNTSIAFGVLGCLLSGALMTITSPAQEEEDTSETLYFLPDGSG